MDHELQIDAWEFSDVCGMAHVTVCNFGLFVFAVPRLEQLRVYTPPAFFVISSFQDTGP
jgi:hypothetical protein